MEQLNLNPTKTTPHVFFDPLLGKLVLEGRSSPEDSIGFYSPIMDKLNGSSYSTGTLTVEMKFDYFNSSSGRCLMDMIRVLGHIHANGTTITVNWYYEEEDDDMLEMGEDFEDISNLTFQYHIIQDLPQ